MNLQKDGNEITNLIKKSSWFPFKSGHLKFDATNGRKISNDTYVIKFDSEVAHYIPYLEEGTSPHDIPRAFGRPLPFGIGGQFNGFFHPGSTKHKGFISKKSIQVVLDYYRRKYNATIKVITK